MENPDYPNQPISIEEQVKKLADKGLGMTSMKEAVGFLEWNNFYRIKPYLQVFTSDDKTCFLQGTSINHVKSLYLFDAKLRNLIFKACHRIEIALRAQLVHHFSMEFGTNWYDDQTFYLIDGVDINKHFDILNTYIDEANENGIVFIVNHFNKYGTDYNPPAWKVMEIFPLGTLIFLYEKAKKVHQKK